MTATGQPIRGYVVEIFDGDYFVMAAPVPPSVDVVRAFAAEAGVVFPEDYVAFATSTLSGMDLTVKEEVWPAPTEFEVGEAWTFMRGLTLYGLAEGTPDWIDQRRATEGLSSYVDNLAEEPLVPFLKIYSNPNVWCFTRTGSIVRLWPGASEPEEIEESFYDVVRAEITNLHERKRRKLGR